MQRRGNECTRQGVDIMIPEYLLPHTVTRIRETVADEWGGVTSSSVSIPHTRIEPQTGRTWGLTADMPMIRARLFANDADINEGDRITFDGVTYTVQTVRKLYGFTYDHMECDLT